MKTVAQLEEELKEARQKEYEESQKQKNAYETLKNTTVESLCVKALELEDSLREFNNASFKDINALFDLLQEYSKKHASGKGNFRVAYKNFRVAYRKQGRPTFDEKSIIAEECIKNFVTSKFDKDKDTKDLIMSLLERKNGEFDINLIQKLYKMEDRFQDENWRKGIQLLKESYSYELSKDYINFQLKDNKGEWRNINLNFSSI